MVIYVGDDDDDDDGHRRRGEAGRGGGAQLYSIEAAGVSVIGHVGRMVMISGRGPG